MRGYDPETGKELWKLGPNSEVTVGYAGRRQRSGVRHRRVSPRPSGLCHQAECQRRHQHAEGQVVQRSHGLEQHEGTYIPTPLYYKGMLYTCGNNGVVTAYEAKTGERIYPRGWVAEARSRRHRSRRTAGSTSQTKTGTSIVVLAGRRYQEIAKNYMKEVIMSHARDFGRPHGRADAGHVYGIGEK